MAPVLTMMMKMIKDRVRARKNMIMSRKLLILPQLMVSRRRKNTALKNQRRKRNKKCWSSKKKCLAQHQGRIKK